MDKIYEGPDELFEAMQAMLKEEDLSKALNDISLEVIDPANVQASVGHAISQVPGKLTIDPPVKVMLAVLIDYVTINKENLEVWVSTKQQTILSHNDLRQQKPKQSKQFLPLNTEAEHKSMPKPPTTKVHFDPFKME